MKMMSKTDKAIRIREKLVRNCISFLLRTKIDRPFPKSPIRTVKGVTINSIKLANVSSMLSTFLKAKENLRKTSCKNIDHFIFASGPAMSNNTVFLTVDKPWPWLPTYMWIPMKCILYFIIYDPDERETQMGRRPICESDQYARATQMGTKPI